MAGKTRLKADASKKKLDRTGGDRTDWVKLRRMSAARIRKGIAADLEARGTDENFWRSAKVVLPTR
jgi:hypothetical protein